MVLELVHVRVHAVCGGRSHGTAREAIGRLGRSGIEDRVVLEIGRHGLSGIEERLDLGMCDVARHDNGSCE